MISSSSYQQVEANGGTRVGTYVSDESDFDIEDIQLDGLSEDQEIVTGCPSELTGDNSSWQLRHEDIPSNPNQLSTSLASKLSKHSSLADFKFADDESNIIDTVQVKDQTANPLVNSVGISWGDLGLSRPLLKSVSQILKFPHPTNIQCNVIPPGISGKDILATAATGSGKTAAFLLPIIERILLSPNVVSRRKDKDSGKITGGRPATRAVVLLPTRELAVQCWSMLKALTTFVPITSSLVVGGFDSKDQKVDLSKSPDVIVATPGRLLDHILNTQGVHLDTVDMVVLDEADRLLEMGFKESITEILKAIPKKTLALKKGKSNMARGQCQTLLFSATLSAGVKELAAFILSDAVTARITDPTRVVSSLFQEFVKLGREDVRECAFFSLLESVVHTKSERDRCKGRVIVFFREKKEAHRAALIAQIFGLSVAELNGNMNQVERMASMADFQSGRKRYLFATDIAGRGLDLPNIELVINYRLPFELDAEVRYIHRVGRTARMGRTGRSITLYTAEEYPVVKRIIKQSVDRNDRERIFERKISVDLSLIWAQRIQSVQKILKEIENEEKLEQEIYVSSKKIAKVENLSKHKDKIRQRPQKVWINEEGKRNMSWSKLPAKRQKKH